jgi:hypothetical protein
MQSENLGPMLLLPLPAEEMRPEVLTTPGRLICLEFVDYMRAFLPQSGQKKKDGLTFDPQCGHALKSTPTSPVG